jgi:hypothetical protein
VDLTGADLSSTNLREFNLTNANLTDSVLTGADLTNSNLTDTILTNANLDGTVISGATYNNNLSQEQIEKSFSQEYWNAYADGPIGGDEAIQYVSDILDAKNGHEIVDAASYANVDSGTGNRDYIDTLGLGIEFADFGIAVINTGEGSDIIGGGKGDYKFDGGAGFDLFIPSYTKLENVYDIDEKVISQNGVYVELETGKVTYLGLDGKSDDVENIEWFLGTTGDDLFIGSQGYQSQYTIQAFNPSGGRDEIFGAEDRLSEDLLTLETVHTVVDYSNMQGGQGVVFILSKNEDDENVDVRYTADGENISDDAGVYWNNWLPSAEEIVGKDGFISSISESDPDKNGATVILDSFGDVDLAYNIDQYIGSDEADVFFGSNENDLFDAGMGAGNFMSGGLGKDELIVSGDDLDDYGIDHSTIKVGRAYDTYEEVVGINGTEIIEHAAVASPATSIRYQVDFNDVYDLNMFIENNLSDAIKGNYKTTTEYSLYLEAEAESLTGFAGVGIDEANKKISVEGVNLNVLNGIAGDSASNFVLVAKDVIEGSYIIEGTTIPESGVAKTYSTIIEDVEKVTLTSDNVEYIGLDTLVGDDDSYELLKGGQGDLGDMLYVATGEYLESTTGKFPYGESVNFLTGDVFYSGHHQDFDRTEDASLWGQGLTAAYATSGGIEQAKIWNDETAEFFIWYDGDKTDNSIEGFEIAVKYEIANEKWGIDNARFDTFQNVVIDQALADSIKLQFGESLNVELGEYRVLYEAAFSDIETIINSDANVENWNFDFPPNSSRSTFYIQVGGDTTADNGNAMEIESNLINVKVERVSDDANGFKWSINPQAEILVNMPIITGSEDVPGVVISGDSAETIEAGEGSDIMMGRGGSDNYKINKGDTIERDESGEAVEGDYGVVGDVINEIGGSSNDKSDSITLSTVTSIDELTFTRTNIKNEEWTNTLRIDVDYIVDGVQDGEIDDTLYVFDHYNQDLGFRAVEKLFLDDGWDTNEIWNLATGEGSLMCGETYAGSDGQDVLVAGRAITTTLYGGDGQDIMIGDNYGRETIFKLGNENQAWDNISDMIQGFGDSDTLDLSRLGIGDNTEITTDGNKLYKVEGSEDVLIADFSNFKDGLTLDELLVDANDYIQYAGA